MAVPGDQAVVRRASSALADVDTTGWAQRFDLLSDPNRLEILLVQYLRPAMVGFDLCLELCGSRLFGREVILR